ncbi:tRNA pseudouridine(38/39) synthase [Arachis hypogaea]|uniref:tRNA pseudouridine synthase n=1 Tax=Arachis hypogaea TaxID=3818 RepID=A0A444Y3G2_ARAHY|nr:tRNA pseudouridine(38/39) synthase [Arachis hypogaea]RYQ96464.1 hypothetical protein Ahy_B08g092227 isoform B [Arachis hypogaea]
MPCTPEAIQVLWKANILVAPAMAAGAGGPLGGIYGVMRLYGGIELWVIKIRGSAFLWHHVRCMVAVLFMIGKGLESPNVIDMLLDTTSIPRKQYTMASDIPLVLQSYSGEALRVHLVNECQTYQLEAAIFHEALRNCVPLLEDQPTRGIKKKPSHVPIMLRPTEQSCEERRSKFDST